MLRTAIAFALVAMISWGIWAHLAAISTRALSPELAMIISYASSVVVAGGYVAAQGDPPSLSSTGTGYALLAGVFGAVGAISFYAGVGRGSTAIVTTISALYFVVAAVLAIAFFGESLGLRDLLGITFAVLAVFLLAT